MSGQDFSGSGPVRAGLGFDEERLADWMAASIDGFEGPLTVSQFNGGQSNPTYRLDAGSGTYVLRRKPPGELLKGAHAIEREAQALEALGGLGFPVPRVHALCTDAAVISTPFYVMDMVAGRTFWNPSLPGEDATTRAGVFDAMNAAMAALHAIRPADVGLERFGRADNYVARQVARWSDQYRADDLAGRDPHLDRLIEWLPANIPAGDEASIIHGDFRIDNLIFAAGSTELLAVLDWELSTIGHPLADFAYHLMMYRMPRLTIPGLAGRDLAALGIPDEASYVASYCRRTGRSGIPDLDFFLAFNMFRFAAIIHGIKGRAMRGTAASAQAGRLVADLPVIAELGWKQALASAERRA